MSSQWWQWVSGALTLPSLPTLGISLPSNLQAKFLSFALRRSIGRFVRPGQLEAERIDSQIGSGYVKVDNLELDHDAVNGLLAGLPVRLSQGTIGSIIARVPWPNPLTSTLGLSVSSLHLVLEVTDVAENVPPTSMAESLASLSESFVHDDLDHEEEAQLRHSVHRHARTTHEQHLPGGFEDSASPEVAVLEPEVDETTLFSALVERLVARFVLDLQDLRIVLVKPDLTELIFAVAEIRYGDSSTEVSESLPAGSPLSHASGAVRDDRTVTVAGVTLSIKSSRTPSASVDHTPTPARTPSQEPATRVDAHLEGREVDSPGSIRVLSPILSDSDLDDEATMALSQSLFFPPRSASPAGSVASSMYQSAISEGSPKSTSVAMRDIDDEPFLNPDHHSEDNRSSATQPEITSMPPAHPIVLREPNSIVPMAPPAESTHSQPNIHSIIFSMSDPLTITVSKPARRQTNTEHETKAPGDLSVSGRRAMSVSVSVGVLAIALRAHHIRDILALSQAFARDSPQDVSASPSPSTSRPVFEVVTSIRGLVVVLLPHDLARRHGWNDTLKSYYNQPLVPPPISPAYSRLFVDGVQSSIRIQTSPHGTEKGVFETTTSIGLDVTDISLFSFHNMDSSTSYALPVLITDPLLHQQYSQNHHQPPLPRSDTTVEPRNMSSFEVVDWTDPTRRVETAKVSSWRVRPSASLHQRSGVGITTLGLSTSPPVDGYAEIDTLSHLRGGFTRKAISMNVVNQVSTRKSNITSSSHITASSTPLHIFADLGSLESSDASYDSRLLVFVDECLPTRPAMEASTSSSILNVDEDRSPRALYTPRARATELPMTPHTEMTRQHIVNELGLEFDYVNEGHTNSHSRKPKQNEAQAIFASLSIPMVRIQLRCPAPPTQDKRSGALVLDLHHIDVSSGRHSTATRHARFGSLPDQPHSSDPDTSGRNNEPDELFVLRSSRMVVSYVPDAQKKATAIASLGSAAPLTTSVPSSQRPERDTPLALIRMALRKPTQPSRLNTSKTVVTVDVPAVAAFLSKAQLDGLQYLGDDVTQLVARMTGASNVGPPSVTSSQNPSMIGSRFFARYGSKSSNIGDINPATVDTKLSSETILKLEVGEVCLGLNVPRSEYSQVARPFDIFATKVDVLLELRPDGKDATVATVGVHSVIVHDTVEGPAYTSFPLVACDAHEEGVISPVKVRFSSRVIPETTAKESAVKVTLSGMKFNVMPGFSWTNDLAIFFKAPPGVFEEVVPSERTKVSVKVSESVISLLASRQPTALVLQIGELSVATDLVDQMTDAEVQISVPQLHVLLSEDRDAEKDSASASVTAGIAYVDVMARWKARGYALLAEVDAAVVNVIQQKNPVNQGTRIVVNNGRIGVHLCADTAIALTALISDLQPPSTVDVDAPSVGKVSRREPTVISGDEGRTLFDSVEEMTFRKIVPEVGPAPDLIEDDLPSNTDYIDDSYGTAGGFRALEDDAFEDDEEFAITGLTEQDVPDNVTILAGGETIRMLTSEKLHVEEHHFDTLPPEANQMDMPLGDTDLQVRVQDCNLTLFLHDGYDWPSTRKNIEEETKAMRRRLMKLRQMLANGQAHDPSSEETSSLLYNSVYVGLDENVEGMDSDALIAAIDQELEDEYEVASQSSWQTLVPMSAPPTSDQAAKPTKRKILKRSRHPSIEFRLLGVALSLDQYKSTVPYGSRVLCTVENLQILDHIKTSTWKMFLTDMQRDLRGIIRETGSNMVRLELLNVRPVPGNATEEARLRAKLLPLRLHVDQDALDFLKKFFSFRDPNAAPPNPDQESSDDTYFQHAEVFPVDIKLDYKPRRVDYRALREGKTIELMNFFHFDGSEMTLRHIRLQGVSGWARLGDLLNDLWTPDVTATQLVDVISGVAPIRSVVNMGSGVADLVLLPIAQYKKDGRIVRGLQKGGKAFMKSTGMEALKLGARLATGTQVILEQAEGLLGAQFKNNVMTETVQIESDTLGMELEAAMDETMDGHDQFSRYADQPLDAKQGIRAAYKTLHKNLNTAAQTILAVPMEVYERSGTEGPVRAVIRAVPIAVLKPMIGASGALRETLLGIHNTFESDARQQAEAKYKQR